MTKERIGFIGVGLMGHGMAKNILEKGFPLAVLGNRNRAPVEDLVQRGAREVKSAKALAEASDIIFLCVTDSSVVETVIRGPDGIREGAHPDLIVVDCSTANPVSTEALAHELAEIGVTLVDAPLGGTPAQAETGQLTAMVGASPEIFRRVEPAIAAWAAKIVHLGPVGTGHKVKLLNNFIAMGYAAIFAEALAIGRANGVEPETLDRVIRGGRMDSGFYQTFMGYALEGNRDSHKFTLANAFKDMRYVDAMADSVQMPNPISSATKNLFGQAVKAGMGEDYVPFLADFVARASGLPKYAPKKKD
ncbi:MAG: NAD(P)-dependent oxidoreductase [Rhabdaerophilum calidifontis]